MRPPELPLPPEDAPDGSGPPPQTEYAGAKVLITGGLGFIGSNLAHALVDLGANVTLIDSLVPIYGGNMANVRGLESSVTINVCDLRDPFAMRYLLRGADYVFNLAGQTSHVDSMVDPHTDLAINAGAQLHLLESCRAVAPNARIVYASTRQIYGRPGYLPVDEQHPIKPVDVNGINKWAGEAYHVLYQDVYGLRSSVLRLTNTYGPRMRVKDARQTFLGIWIRNALQGRPIQVFGDGRQLRDFNFVDDVVRALLMAGAQPASDGHIYNLGSSEVISLMDLSRILTELVPSATVEIVPFPPERKVIDIGDYFAEFSLIEQELGWRPEVSLRDGLQRTLDYYRSYHDAYWSTES